MRRALPLTNGSGWAGLPCDDDHASDLEAVGLGVIVDANGCHAVRVAVAGVHVHSNSCGPLASGDGGSLAAVEAGSALSVRRPLRERSGAMRLSETQRLRMVQPMMNSPIMRKMTTRHSRSGTADPAVVSAAP